MDRDCERRHLAAASAHLHLAAAAHYVAEARGTPPRRKRNGGDIEMGLAGGDLEGHGDGVDDGGLGDQLEHGGDGGHGDLEHGGHGAGHGHGGDADADEEELEWTMEHLAHLYELLLLLASFVPPAPVYKALPHDVVEGLAWTWVVLFYGVFIAIAVTAFTVRVLGTSGS